MNRWAVRIIGILIVIVFLLLMLNLQRQLLMIQKSRRPPATSPAPQP